VRAANGFVYSIVQQNVTCLFFQFAGDESYISIGEGSSIGDRVMVHCSQYPKENPTIVGKGVVVSSGAILHGCVLEDSCLIGEGAQVMDGAKVGKAAVVAPGSLLGVGKSVPAGQLWSGVPARYVRDVTAAEAAKVVAAALENAQLAGEHAAESAKSWQTIEQEEYDSEQKAGRNMHYFRRLSPEVGRSAPAFVAPLQLV
jgi:carbonic anhydrase/acetyltransferase-like protein (isoleucine patch superfamily)